MFHIYLVAFLICFSKIESSDEIGESFEDIVCPRNELLKPCYCDPYVASIQCDIPNTTVCDLSAITSKVANLTTKANVVFSEIAIEDVALHELSQFDLGNLLYKRVAILNSGLRYIHPLAFGRTAETVTYIDLEANRLTDDVFEALRCLPSLEYVSLSNNYLKVIPSHAFRRTNGQFQSRLKGILLTGNRIHTISDHTFFYLPHLTTLHINMNQISRINVSAFEFEDIPIGRKTNLYIDLSMNLLQADSFDAKGLQNINRPVKLSLNRNKVTHLNQSVFEPFLNKHVNNSVDVKDNPLICNCSSYWIHEKRSVFAVKIKNHFCVDNRDLFDYYETEFSKCDVDFNLQL
ncbi:Leucine rich repeat containing protein 10-like protein [Leptotrombidium deliense]|uniref:Leucine rich repeat containing protein 10-like protein n=1 Tax=Leptotrombidium deliense TaxID=299467 RepID=A0A443S1Y3_9ACAR|nr:Leucine rich repeat containing protein 10-like protein [Leptotrombidium deliense]